MDEFGSPGPVGDIVMVPVPVALLPSVYRLLAGEIHDDGVEVASRRAETSHLWSQDMVRGVIREAAPYPSARTLLRLTSSRPGEWISIAEVEQETSLPLDKIKGELGGFTRRLNGSFGQRTAWPVEDRDDALGDERKAYRMPRAVAQLFARELTAAEG